MNRLEIRRRSAQTLFSAGARPFFVTLAFSAIMQLASAISVYAGGDALTAFYESLTPEMLLGSEYIELPEFTDGMKLAMLAVQVLFAFLSFGYMSFCLHTARSQASSVFDLMDGFTIPLRVIVLWLAMNALAFVGFLLLIVPGFFIMYTYAMAPYLLMDHPDWSPFRCMAESRRLMRSHRKDLFLLHLSLLFWRIMTFFPLTEIFARPYITLCDTGFYRELLGPLETDPADDDPPEEKPPWEY